MSRPDDSAQKQPESQPDTLQPDTQLVLKGPDASSSPKDFLLWAGVIFLAALVVYAPALRGQFLWDDDKHVSRNPNLRDGEGLRNIWTKFGWKNGGTIQYYPLTHTSYWLESRFAIGRDGQMGTTIFHVTNVLLHAAAAVLLWLILRELKLPGAWAAAAIFALHPVQVESVAWISERKNVLAGAFFFASILAYLRWVFESKQGDLRLYTLALVLFICAMLSKTVACSMPGVVFVLIWWKRGRLTLRDIAFAIPFFAIGIAMALVTASLEHSQVGAAGADWDLSWAQRILIAGRAVWFYAGKLIWPTRLTFSYPRWDVDPGQPLQWIFPIATLAVIAALFAARKRIGRGPVAAVLIYIGVLFPALGFVNFYPMRYSFVADHFQYLASPALIALVVAAAANWLPRWFPSTQADKPSPMPFVASGIVLAALVVLTLIQSSIYAEPMTLWRDTVRKNDSSWMAHYNLGNELLQRAQAAHGAPETPALLDEAETHFEAAAALRKNHDSAINGWGQVLGERGKHEAALEKYAQALAINPKNFEALANRGQSLRQLKRYDEAIKSFYDALEAAAPGDPRLARLRLSLAETFQGRGDLDAAMIEARQAVTQRPNMALGHLVLGRLLAAKAQAENEPKTAEKLRREAAVSIDRALDLDSNYIDARIALANLMMDVGNIRGATIELGRANQISPEDPRLRDPLARATKLLSTRPSTTRASTTRATQPAR